MLGLAALLAVVAVDMARDAMAVAGDFEEFMPSIFLLAFAFIFMRAGLATRRRGRMPAPALPPLSTVPSSARRRR